MERGGVREEGGLRVGEEEDIRDWLPKSVFVHIKDHAASPLIHRHCW